MTHEYSNYWLADYFLQDLIQLIIAIFYSNDNLENKRNPQKMISAVKGACKISVGSVSHIT